PLFAGVHAFVTFFRQKLPAVLRHILVWSNQFGVRKDHGVKEKERLIPVVADELQDLAMYRLWRIGYFCRSAVFAERDLRCVVPQIGRIVVVGETLTVVAEEPVDSLMFRGALRTRIAQTPF